MPENASKQVVVAGVAELEGPDPVRDAAAAIARGSGAALHLVHAYELPRLFEMSPGLNIAFPEGEDSYHDAVLGKLQGAWKPHAPAADLGVYSEGYPAQACRDGYRPCYGLPTGKERSTDLVSGG